MPGAATLFGLGLSQQQDLDGKAMSGAQLYIFKAQTSEAVTVYKDTALTQPHPRPIVADANGRIPAFWLDTTAVSYFRAQLLDQFGVPQFDEQVILAIGAPSGSAPAPNPTPNDAISTTGDIKFRISEAELPNWLKLNGQTIGNGLSGAVHASGDYLPLWIHLYGLPDAVCHVPGRTGNAANDFNGGLTMTLPDLRGRGLFGTEDMGAASVGWFDGFWPVGSPLHGTVAGSFAGDSYQSLTENDMPEHQHAVYIHPHDHTLNSNANVYGGTSSGSGGAVGDVPSVHVLLDIDPTTARARSTPGSSGVPDDLTAKAGNATNRFVNMPPFILGTWYIHI